MENIIYIVFAIVGIIIFITSVIFRKNINLGELIEIPYLNPISDFTFIKEIENNNNVDVLFKTDDSLSVLINGEKVLFQETDKIIDIRFKSPTPFPFKIESYEGLDGEFHSFRTGDPEFDSRMIVYAENSLNTFYYLDPTLRGILRDLSSDYHVSLGNDIVLQSNQSPYPSVTVQLINDLISTLKKEIRIEELLTGLFDRILSQDELLSVRLECLKCIYRESSDVFKNQDIQLTLEKFYSSSTILSILADFFLGKLDLFHEKLLNESENTFLKAMDIITVNNLHESIYKIIESFLGKEIMSGKSLLLMKILRSNHFYLTSETINNLMHLLHAGKPQDMAMYLLKYYHETPDCMDWIRRLLLKPVENELGRKIIDVIILKNPADRVDLLKIMAGKSGVLKKRVIYELEQIHKSLDPSVFGQVSLTNTNHSGNLSMKTPLDSGSLSVDREDNPTD